MSHYPLPSHSGTVCPSIHPFIRPSICIQPDRHTSQPVPPFCCGVPTAQEKCMLFGPVLPFTPVQTLLPSSLMTIEQPALSPIATAQSISRQAWPLSTRHQRTCFYRFFSSTFIHHLTLSCIVTVRRCCRGALHFLGRRRRICRQFLVIASPPRPLVRFF